MAYEDITEPKACIDAIERAFGTDHAEQAASLYEDCEDLDQFNETAIREIEEYLLDRFEEDSDAMYIVNRVHVILKLIEADDDEARIEAEDEFLTEATKTVKLELKLDAQIALAIGSGRTELLPSEERIAKHLTPDDETTPNEAALMANLRGWIGMAVEASRALIEAKTKVAELEQEVEAFGELMEAAREESQKLRAQAQKLDRLLR